MGVAAIKYGEQDIANLFCMPQTLVTLIESCLSGAGVPELAEIVLQDAALSARVINAASKAGSTRIDAAEPVTSAIQQLGLPVVTGIALQAAKQVVAHDFTDTSLHFLNSLWFSSRVAGQFARCLSPTVSYLHVEEAQLSGLLLNLGLYTLFSKHGDDYAELAAESKSSPALSQRELQSYQQDHLHVAEDVIEPWKLDSFLIDAVRFLHQDVVQIENSSQLLKIARLSHQICQHPLELTDDVRQLAERLFQFSRSEIDYLFSWAKGLYKGAIPALEDPEKLREQLKEARGRLIDLIFALADQEGARARLLGNNRPELLATEARHLYLENSPAGEAIFMLVDHKNNQLAGIVAEGQARLISELKVPLDASLSLVVQALVSGETNNSFSAKQPLSVTDQLLLRIGGKRGFFCQPFLLDGRLLGAVVLSVDREEEMSTLHLLRLRMFGQVVSESIAQLSNDVPDNFFEGSAQLRRVSHELSNPLTIIGNYAEVIGHLLPDDEHREFTDAIKREVRRVDDVLNYYLNQQELPPFPDRDISLNQLVYEAVDALQEGELQPRRIDVRFNLKNDLAKVSTNGVLVKQILVNLLKNAAEAVTEGGEIQLATRDSYCSDGGRFVEVVVQDNGGGIDSQVKDQLFRPVVSTKGPGHAGVGLSIVKGMVDDLGGRISYHSSPAAGTGFHLQIPCGDDDFSAASLI
ncbi:His Kinase A (phospho-acceptor) domain-containing protein [Malonomonas rubra DSM 5091]|uniref:histidine kinase n=1 Tax=Malonomonas rubra DSM 5091 TaxID=1122189 RepID=A0A1M6FDZ5_MALRU|nr:HDOD domain-containing protein [Malonomonas rubra]SHI95954.1 His Kinase A (phospho-acceptor) domain-containing protein [Malonomonas rubra DSM 5091]